MPQAPENGYVAVQGTSSYISGDEVTLGTMIRFSCTANHALIPDNSITYCIGGQWINEVPKCASML